jgi:hypothetical protein
VDAKTIQCSLPLPNRVPNTNFSYSDHEAVSATINLRKVRTSFQSGPEYRRLASLECRNECVSAIVEAQKIIKKAESHVKRDKNIFLFISVSLFIILILSFLPLALLNHKYHVGIEAGLFIPRFLITAGIIFFALMGTVFNQRETNALNSAKISLKLIHDQDIKNNPFL